MSKKILIITDAWAPQVNGVVTVMRETLKRLPESDYEVKIVHPGMFFGMPLPFYPEIKFVPFGQGVIRKIIKQFKPDYIHIDTESALWLAGRRACISQKKRFTTAYHTNFPQYFEKRTGLSGDWVYSYLRWFHGAAACTMVSTHLLKQDLADHRFENLVVRPLGVDTDLFRKNEEILPGTRPVFMFLGRLAVEKWVEDFLQCNLPGEKWVIGDGPERSVLESKYPDVRFFGYKTGKDLVDVLSWANVLVLPSRTETFGLVILEAMSCGLPVAAYPAPGPLYLISDGIDGALSTNLEEAAISCLSLDRNKCREKALAYSWEHSVDTFLANLVDANEVPVEE